MKIVKQSNLPDINNVNINNYIQAVDNDLKQLFTALTGRLRFGTATDGYRGENIAGVFQTFTSDGVADAENTIAHGLGSVPVGYLVVNQDAAGSLYDSGTTWTSTNIYLKCSESSVTFTIFILK